MSVVNYLIGIFPLSLCSPPADIISTVEFNHTGELLATGDKGGRVVIFQREPEVYTYAHKLTIFYSDRIGNHVQFPVSYILD